MEPSQNNYQTEDGPGSRNRIDLNNFQPDPSMANSLRSRLYDKGISNQPMPSVKRPIEENISSKPFSAKMNSSKIQALSPLKKKIQDLNTKIISGLNESYKQAAIQDAQYLGAANADYYRKQHVIVPQPKVIKPSNVGQKLQNSMAVSVGQPRMTGQLLNRKQAQIEPLDATYQHQVQEKLNRTAGSINSIDPNRIMAGPPSLVYAGFEGGPSMSQKNLEQARSKFLVDKLTGKLPPRTLPPLEQSITASGSRQRLRDDKDKPNELAPDIITEIGQENNKKPKKVQTWTQLDKFIELLLDSKGEDETVFMYLVPVNKNDPYDLQNISFRDIQKGTQYYTLSGNGLTLYEGDTPVEFLSLGQWLIERDSYNHIKDFPFFKRFKSWKFMRMWKKSIKKTHRDNVRNRLVENLFILQDHFRTHLFTHRKHMLAMSEKNTFVDVSYSAEPRQIDEFSRQQEERRIELTKKITEASKTSRQNIRECFNKVLGQLRTHITGEIQLEENKRTDNPEPKTNSMSMKRSGDQQQYQELGFPPGMTYAHRSSLRRECSRFLRFAYLADFLSLEALSKIYINSLEIMIEKIDTLNGFADMKEIMQMEFDEGNTTAGQAPRGREPLFYTQVRLDDSRNIPESEIVQVEIDDFLPPPRGKSQVQDFDLTSHLVLEEPKGEEEEEEEFEEDDEVVVKIYKQTVPNIQQRWIKLVPDNNQFIQIIQKTFNDGLSAIKCFEKWAKHKELVVYYDCLEAWDEKPGDEQWDSSDSLNLDPHLWIHEHPVKQTSDKEVRRILDSAYDKAHQFLTRFQPLLEIYWRNKKFDKEILVDELLKNPVESLGHTLNLFKHYQSYFQSNLPSSTDIGLVQLDSKDIKESLLPTPKKLQEEIEKLIPAVTKERTLRVAEWLQESILNLTKPVNDVSDFVIQLQQWNKINDQFQTNRDKIDLYGQFMGILANQGMNQPDKSVTQAIREAEKEITRLSQIIAEVESKQESEIERFKRELQDLIPKLCEDIDTLLAESEQPQYLDKNSEQSEMIKQLDEKVEIFKKLEETAIKYNGWQEELRTDQTQFDTLEDLRKSLLNRHLLWHSLVEWKELKEVYERTLFNEINEDDIALQADNYQKIVNRVIKILPPNLIQDELKELVETFKGAMPIVKALRNKNLEEVHKEAINDLLQGGGKINVDDENFTLKSLIDLNVVQFQDEICAISVRATGEARLKRNLAELEEQWKSFNLVHEKYKGKDDVFVLAGIDDLYQFLDESLAQVNMIRGNQYKAVIEEEAEKLRKDLITLNTAVEEWLKLQKDWQYFENIFSSGEIKKTLPDETQKFDSIDKIFKQLMNRIDKNPSAKNLVTKTMPNIVRVLQDQNAIVEEIHKALAAFLETKRNAFPRFYFLSDEELLEILANTDNKDFIMQYLKALFDGLVKLKMNDVGDSVSMLSKEGEEVVFSKPAKAQRDAEGWLEKIQTEMRVTLLKRLRDGHKSYSDQKSSRKEWVLKNHGQIVLAVCMINWCIETENAIQDMANDPEALTTWHQQNEDQLKQLTYLVCGKLEDLQRAILVALITQDVHARDIVEELKKDSVSSLFDFNWQKQLRYYWDEENTDSFNVCSVRQIQATLNYGYEYMGATTRLVITPLTDRCWITITGALHIKLGANPAGPAGTGKTESTKDLAKGIAILCIVYNCSEQVDYQMMGKHFSGLAQQGCWTCLDEFNRINVEVLSVIAQQLLDIRNALLQEKCEEFEFQGVCIKIRPEFGCHITMNPGYAGRTELPDNLKVLFRPVAMMIPSYRLIAQVMLYSEGFAESNTLSQKMVQLYQLSSQQLSAQDHYDFGMRAVKSVLVMAGELKRSNPEQKEDAVLIRAMKDANVPKFLKEDLPLFNSIVQDLFPSSEITKTDYTNMEKEIKKALRQQELQPHPPMINKVIQLFETFNVRFGVMLIGFTGSGKTACYETLARMMTNVRMAQGDKAGRQFQIVNMEVINPKSITMNELYGSVDLINQEWTDGLASKIMRNASNEQGEEKNWTVFDGPVDALWIESMNTVLDDNMTLCLANGQRLKLRPQMRMLFEVNDLAVASPATVSRCGMVYMTQEELGWEPYVQSWIEKKFPDDKYLNEDLRNYMWETFKGTVDVGISRVRSHLLSEPIPTDNLQLVRSMCNFLEILICNPYSTFRGDEKQQKKDLESLICFSFTWGLGASLDERSKDYFDTTVRELFKVGVPASNTNFDFWFDMKSKDRTFKSWQDKVQPFQFGKEKPYFELFVENMMTTKYSWCLETLLSGEKPSFFTGASGVGKSVVIQNTLNRLAQKDLNPIYLNFSAQTDSKRTQQSIQEKLEKISRKKLGAPAGKRNAIFVDDINMPKKEHFGASPPIELLRLYLDRKGIYERSAWEWKEVIDTTMIAAAAPPLGGREVLTPRFSTQFNMFCLPEASQGTLETIFITITNAYLKAWNYTEEVQEKGEQAVKSTIEIYETISKEKRPTPAKFHYSFNLRDVSKVIQGMLMTKAMSVKTGEVMARLWVNESQRVFQDRLINDEDRDWFVEQAMEMLSRNFKVGLEKEELFVTNRVKWGDLLKLDAPQRLYEEIPNINTLIKILDDYLDEYNGNFDQKMSLVFFEDAVHHILRICRNLRQPRGNIMLIGVGGSGKQSLTRLASFMYEIQFTQISIKKDYKEKDFLDYIKERLFETGIEGKQVAFTMTDSHILKETFLENINNILNTGEVPNLLLPEDRDKIETDVREKTKLDGSSDIIFQEFIKRVRANFHIVLCMSPVGNALRVRCRNFPALVNTCTIDWFSKWPAEALLFVSQTFLQDVDVPTNEIRESLAKMCMLIHTSVEEKSEKFYDELRRRVYTTPKSYLDLISLYINTLEKKRSEMNVNKNRLANGLSKLNDTNTQIADLKIKLAEAAPILEEKNKNLALTLAKVAEDSAEANAQEQVVLKEKEEVMITYNEAEAIREEVEADLAAAQPEMDKAKAAVNSLDKGSIVEMSSLPKPPEAVQMVMEPIMILLGKTPDWDTAKKEMKATDQFLNKLKDFKPEQATEKALKVVRNKYIAKDDFNQKHIASKSLPAGNLCAWVLALSNYQAVYKKIVPKKEKLEIVSKQASEAKAILDKKLAQVKEVKDKVEELTNYANKLGEEKTSLENQINRDENRMRRAEKLVVLLKDEGIRWSETVKVISGQIERLVGDVFLSCACISYFGGFTGPYRKSLTDLWTTECISKGIPTGDEFSLIKVMGDPVQISEWNMNYLPSDTTSLENGILTTKAERYGLCIDPQQQANRWLKSMLKDQNLMVIKFTNEAFFRNMKECVYNGRPMLIEDLVEAIEPAVDPILLHQEFRAEDGTRQIKLDTGEPIPFGNGFKLYMTTKLPNPHYPPEVCIKVTLINFTVTKEGLEEQMLGDVVIKEKPEVEKQRLECIQSMDNDKRTLKGIEDKILTLLAENEVEQILDADTLIDVLSDSKVKTAQINQNMENNIKIEENIKETRAQYNSVAIRGSILYFVIADLANINDMYQNSLQFVKTLFNKAIDITPKSDDLEQRLENLIEVITRNIYSNVSRGLFEADKLIFTYLISTSVNRANGIISPAGWNFLLRGAQPITNDQKSKKPANPLPKLLTEITYDVIYSAQCNISNFEGIVNDFIENREAWTNWATCLDPQDQALPGEWEEKLTDFQKSILLKCFRSEKLMFAFKNYVKVHMGNFFVEGKPVTMENMYADMDPYTPLVFILAVGADPTDQLLKFAESRNYRERLGRISLGQGQTGRANKLISDSCKNGDWVLLQNCHLSKEFMPHLEMKVVGLPDFEDIHPDFRLFLTSMPVDFFSKTVLQNSVKLTTEPPRGLKANLKRTYAEMTNEFLDNCKKQAEFKKLVFGCAFFHAIIQERRKFGPLGWNIRYEFNDSDLETSNKMLQIFLDEDNDEIPWAALVYVTGHINYGGRVTDDQDRRCLITTLEKYYCADNLLDDYTYTEGGEYRAPPNGDAQSYRDFINYLPEEETPEVFGLHENANIAYQKQESDLIVDKVLSIQPRIVAKSDGAMTPEQIVLEKASQLAAMIPDFLDKTQGQKEQFKTQNNLLPSITTVLVQEMDKFNRLLKVMRTTLEDLEKAINGLILMSSELDSMFLSLQNGKVPDNWTEVSYLSMKPLSSWFDDLIKRVAFMNNWLINGQPNAYWISGFFFPQGFLTGCLQTHARKYQIPIDELAFSFQIMEYEDVEEVEEKPSDGVYVYGLYMDGARYNKEQKCIDEQNQAELYDYMPLIHFRPHRNYEPNPEEYSCPVYKTAARAGVLSTTGQSTNFIIMVEMPVSQEVYAPPAHWVRRAAAMLCNLSE